MEMVGDFKATDLIFKGCYGDSLLYSDTDLHQLKWWGIYLPCIIGGDPHATGTILPASQEACSDQAVPTQGGSFGCTCKVPQG